MDAGDRLRIARELAGLDREQVADRAGRSVSGIGALENGQNKIRPEVAELLAPVVKTTPEWLLYGRGDPPRGYDPAFERVVELRPKKVKAKKGAVGGRDLVPIIGRVGADPEGRVLYATGDQSGDMVPRPFGGSKDVVALQVVGYSMRGWADDGSLVYFDSQRTPPGADLLGIPCVVETEGGDILLKRLLKGSRPGVFDLESINGPTMPDQKLRWAAEVTVVIQPREARRIILKRDDVA